MSRLITRLLSRITEDPREQRNIKHLGLNMLVQNADLPLYTGTELQAFQVRVGLQTGQMGNIGMAGAITTALSMLLSTTLVDKVEKRVAATAWTVMGMSLFPLIVLAMCVGPESLRSPRIVYYLMVVFTIVNGVFYSMNSLLWAMVFTRSIRTEIRGRFMGLVGVVGGVTGIVLGLLSAFALHRYGFPYGFVIAFAMGGSLVILSSVVIRGTKELPELKGDEVARALPPLANMKQVVKMRQFKLLMPANVLRGLGDGAGVFAMAVGMKRLGLSFEYAGYTTALTYFGGVVATTLIGFTVDRFGAGKVIPRIEIVLAIGLMGMVISGNAITFLVFFLLWQIMLTMEGLSIPLVHYEIVPVEVIGAFSGIRLLTLTIMAGISSFVIGHLLESMPPLLVYAFCAVIKVLAGMLYWYGVKVIKNEKSAADMLKADMVASEET